MTRRDPLTWRSYHSLFLSPLVLPQDALEQFGSPFCSLMPTPGLSEFPAIIAHPELHPEAARAALSAAMAAREALESGEELHPLADTPTVVG